MAGWSAPATADTPHFPPELIPEVARRLTSLQDFFAVRACSRGYRAVLPVTLSNLASQAPVLLLVPREDGATESAVLFHLPLRRRLRFRLPLTRQDSNSRIRIFSLGCLVVICDYPRDPRRLELRMVHLLTGQQTRLPSLVNFSNNFVLSGDILLNWGYFGCTFRFCRPGDADWTMTSIGDAYCLEDMICVNGTIYMLVSTGHSYDMPSYHLAVVELSENRSSVELVFIRDQLDAQTMHLPVGTPLSLNLAECRGELIIVSSMGFNPSVYHVFGWNSWEAKWARITSLGGCALFFEWASFQGCLGPDHPGIRKDCLYFTDEGLWSEYSLVDGSFRQSDAIYPGGQSQGDFRASGWVFPNMC